MATVKTMAIGDYFEQFVSEQVAKGRFNNSSEVLRAGLRLLEEHELHLREQKSIVKLKEADAQTGLEVTRQEAADVTRSVTDAMRALAHVAVDPETDQQTALPAIPSTKGLLRSQIAAE